VATKNQDGEAEAFALGDFWLESGRVLSDAKLVYKTYGHLNAEKTNAVLLCSYFTGDHTGYEFLIQPGRCFDPDRYFVISTNLFCGGLSSSPSNMGKTLNGSGGGCSKSNNFTPWLETYSTAGEVESMPANCGKK
jgi:homoserine acetyltransferase